MIFRVLFIALLLSLFAYGFRQRKVSAIVSLSIKLIALAGLGFVISPDTLTAIANWMGVGRGVDLVTYLSVFCLMIMVMNMHFKYRILHNDMTLIAREIGLARVAEHHPQPSQSE